VTPLSVEEEYDPQNQAHQFKFNFWTNTMKYNFGDWLYFVSYTLPIKTEQYPLG